MEEKKSCFNCKRFGTSNPWFVFCKFRKAQLETFEEAIDVSNKMENDENYVGEVKCKYWRDNR